MGIPDSTRVQPAGDRPVEVQIMGAGFLDVFLARDISVTGVGLWVPHQFEGCDIEAEVELVLTIPSHKSFLAKGSIRHRTKIEGREKLFGLKFTELAKTHRAQIRNYIESCVAAGLTARN